MCSLYVVYSIRAAKEADPDAKVFDFAPFEQVGGWSEKADSLVEEVAEEHGGVISERRSGQGSRDLRVDFPKEKDARQAGDKILDRFDCELGMTDGSEEVGVRIIDD